MSGAIVPIEPSSAVCKGSEKGISNSPIHFFEADAQETHSWKPSKAGHFKVNYDGAIFKEQGKAGIGVVMNSRGHPQLRWSSAGLPFTTNSSAYHSSTGGSIGGAESSRIFPWNWYRSSHHRGWFRSYLQRSNRPRTFPCSTRTSYLWYFVVC